MADFFEQIAGSLNKGIKAVSSKGKELVETAKLKGEIKNVQGSIESKFQTLGKKVFEMFNSGAWNEDELRVECSEITLLFKKVSELEEALKQVELEALKRRYGPDTILCAKCGSPNKSDASFCVTCGSPIAKEVPEGRTCPTCGASLKEDAKFCARCGGKV